LRHPKPLTIVPLNSEISYRFTTYIDYKDTTMGSVGVLTDTTDSLIGFNFTLDTVNHNPDIDPIVGFNIHCVTYNGAAFLDVSEYDTLDIKITMRKTLSFRLYLKTYEYFTDTAEWFTLRNTGESLTIDPRSPKISIAFKELPTPEWWIDLIGKEWFNAMPEVPDYTKVMALDFQDNPKMSELHVPERMEIREITFRKGKKILYGRIKKYIVSWIIFVTVILMVYYTRHLWMFKGFDPPGKNVPLKHPVKPSPPPDLPLPPSRDEEETKRIVSYLRENYTNADLTVEMVARETGVSSDHITTLLRNRFGMKYTEYLNFLRIEQAKHLLEKSDLNIMQVALSVGYKSQNQLNRVFRQATGMAPLQYRKNRKSEE
jgi:AraC-like DNA-binding protein